VTPWKVYYIFTPGGKTYDMDIEEFRRAYKLVCAAPIVKSKVHKVKLTRAARKEATAKLKAEKLNRENKLAYALLNEINVYIDDHNMKIINFTKSIKTLRKEVKKAEKQRFKLFNM